MKTEPINVNGIKRYEPELVAHSKRYQNRHVVDTEYRPARLSLTADAPDVEAFRLHAKLLEADQATVFKDMVRLYTLTAFPRGYRPEKYSGGA
jgi:hypothetical protein